MNLLNNHGYVVFTICIHIFITVNGEGKKIYFMLENFSAQLCCFLPAVHHHGPCIWRIASFHPSQECQERSGVLWYPVVWPGSELELPHLSLLTGAILNMERKEG